MDSGQSQKDYRPKIDGTLLKMTGLQIPDPEVKERAHRRRFTRSYKLAILREADCCTERGELGALLRREGYHRSFHYNRQSPYIGNSRPSPDIGRQTCTNFSANYGIDCWNFVWFHQGIFRGRIKERVYSRALHNVCSLCRWNHK